MRSFAFVAATWLICSMLACEKAGTGKGNPISVSNLRTAWQDSICQLFIRCGVVPDKETCITTTDWSYVDAAIAGVLAGRVQYDGAAAAECLDVMGNLGCNRTDSSLQSPPSCLRAFQGTLGAGAICEAREECVSANCSTVCYAACCEESTCEPPPTEPNPVPIGGDCSEPTQVCVDGAECNFPSASQGGPICMSGARLGDACDLPTGNITTPRRRIECMNNTICKPSSSPLGGTCMSPPARGEACDPEVEPCNSSLDFCDPVSGRCVGNILPGQPCPSGTGCVFYARCDSSTGMCIAEGTLGQACDEITGPGCMGSLACVAGACAFPDPWPICQ